MVEIIPFSGTAQGLVAEQGRYNVDGASGYVTKLNRGTDGAVIAKKGMISWLLPSNPGLIADAALDVTAPVGPGRKIQVSYPAQSCSPNDTYKGNTGGTAALAGQPRPAGGTQFFAPLPAPAKRVRARYGVYVPAGFDFRLGGKLPGISTANISANGGQVENAGVVSVTCRHMWRSGGGFETYFYTAENQDRWGTQYGVSLGSPVFLQQGWNLVESEVWMNDVGTPNGGCIERLNGVEFANRSDLLFRHNDDLLFGGLWFSTFFGGNTAGAGDNTWETLVDTNLVFSDLYFEAVNSP